MHKSTILFIEPTPKTPQIDLNQFTGELIFDGRSIPENAAKVYEPVLKWMTDYILNARPVTNLRLNLEYFNTASSLWLAKILKVLLQINVPDFTLLVHLYLPVEEYEEMNEFDDIKDAFYPLTNIFSGNIDNVGIKLYGIDDEGEIVKDTLVLIDQEQFTKKASA